MEPSSRWSLIVLAQGVGPGARAALGELIRRYETSVLALIRYRRHPPDQTPEDLKQEFFARTLRRNDLSRLAPERGHFRGWLHTAVTRFLLNDWDRWHSANARERAPERAVREGAGSESPEELYLAAYSWDTLLHTLKQLREESNDKQRFDALQRFLPGPQVDLDDLAPIAASLGMTRTALAAAVCRLRERFKEMLSIAVAQTLDIDMSHPDAAQELAREMALIYRMLYERSHAW